MKGKSIGLGILVLLSGLVLGCREEGLVQRISYHGWDAVRLDNGAARAVVVPDIARIMSFGRSGGPNLIWQDPALWGTLSSLTNSAFQNYGGAKLWAAPQDVWGWPVDPVMDRGPCSVMVSAEGAVRWRGMPSLATGVRLDRSMQLDVVDTARLDLQYTMENTSVSNVSWGIWNVIQVRPGGRVLLPIPDGTRVWEHRDWSILEDWEHRGDVLVLRHANQEGKVHTIGSEGWVAYEKDGEVLVVTFPADPAAAYPSNHGNCEVYASGLYVELEHVAPVVELAPGEVATTTESWFVFSLEGASLTDRELAARIRGVYSTR